MAISSDQKMRILEIIHGHKHELGLVLKGNGKGGAAADVVWTKIMNEARSQGLWSGTELQKFKKKTWWQWRGDIFAKYLKYPYRERSKFSENQKFIIVNICGESIPKKNPKKTASKGDRRQKCGQNSSACPSSQSAPPDSEQKSDDGSESYSAMSLDDDSPLEPSGVLSSPRNVGDNADCENPTLSERVEKLEALARKQQEQLESQEKLLLQMQQQLQQQPQMFQFQPPPQYQFPPFVPNQWSTSQATQGAQPNTLYIYDIPNKK